MGVEAVKEVLLWCVLIDYGFLILWAVFFIFAHGWMYRMHSMWFKISTERFDSIHYMGMAFFKIAIFVFNLAPYIALRIVTG